ncbi:YqiA/YcfP family alpha/beta fold hydrolase [Pelomicrobium sp.]|jgi:predicted esterase YcpF (UPF0227 family)|uniref:YqiA/YcfP family alpha/beta fold hydrolase n=1 Tax=Pelomicrobium sp. TaxID=2815319 RepID=UPI002FDE6E88
MTALCYIHGFNSSPASSKAQMLRERLERLGKATSFRAPALPHRPAQAIQVLEQAIAQLQAPVTLVGSSLGGYYATWLAERHGLKAVLVNPAVDAPRDLAQCLGVQQNFHTGERYEFTQTHLDELAALEVPAITRPERYLLLVATGDEVLDYRRAVEKFAGARQIVVEGSDHGFSDFGHYLDEVLAFAGLAPSP